MNHRSSEFPDDPHLLAVVLDNTCGIDGVRSEPRRVTIAVAPPERHVEELPKGVYNLIGDIIEASVWSSEYSNYNRGTVEKHYWTGGTNHSPIIPPTDQPKGYELQFSLVK